ncbi:hypothetical protein [Chryseobacterium indologenes]|uniref:Uncharacterized protein n=1 Tax=Chryseobacterium indologenes TaxID=253 RepID=A0A0N0ZWL9_CHRID|nr:hypothetical protein [Chryseobacterium indologenes]KPE52190.1 hypothetical protein AOB46_04730 [Chryseobacterium indologenes]
MTLDGKKINFNVDYDEIMYWVNSYEQYSEPFLFLRKKDKLAIVKEGKVISAMFLKMINLYRFI